MKRIYIRFPGNNDFINTMCGFVKTIAPNIFLGDWKDITKKEIADLFNTHSGTFYVFYQAYDAQSRTKHHEYKDYLQIDERAIYIDEEIDSFTNYNNDGCLACLLLHNGDIQYTIM